MKMLVCYILSLLFSSMGIFSHTKPHLFHQACAAPDIAPVDIQIRIDKRYEQAGKVDFSIIAIFKNIGTKSFQINSNSKIEGVLELYINGNRRSSRKINSLGSGATTQLVFHQKGAVFSDADYWASSTAKATFFLKSPPGPPAHNPHADKWATEIGKDRAALDCNPDNNHSTRNLRDLYDQAWKR